MSVDLEAEQQVDFGRYGRQLAQRWWLPVAGLILGAIMDLSGMGLATGSSTARWVAVILVTVNAISQVVWFPLAPLWAFLIILLDVTIIYQLTARWDA